VPRDYFLTTARLGFAHWSSADTDLATALWGDTEVSAWLGGPFTDRQISEKLEKEIALMASDRVQYWPIFLLNGDQHVGCAGLRPYPWGESAGEKIYELGFHLRLAYWGLGLAAEAGRAVIEFAFESLDAAALFAGHHPSNPASGRVLLKLGFHFTHDGIYPPTGQPDRCYLLRREAWFSGLRSSN
jgi:ribosomal-protein-alanine N-acetyltransferase